MGGTRRRNVWSVSSGESVGVSRLAIAASDPATGTPGQAEGENVAAQASDAGPASPDGPPDGWTWKALLPRPQEEK